MALETAPWRRIWNADRRGSVLIGECTSDIGVHVHRNAIFMCAPALPYVAACLTVAARPPELRRRSGAFGRRRERPPLWGCLDRHRGGLACAHPCHPPPGVAPLQQSLAGRPPSAAEDTADQFPGQPPVELWGIAEQDRGRLAVAQLTPPRDRPLHHRRDPLPQPASPPDASRSRLETAPQHLRGRLLNVGTELRNGPGDLTP